MEENGSSNFYKIIKVQNIDIFSIVIDSIMLVTVEL